MSPAMPYCNGARNRWRIGAAVVLAFFTGLAARGLLAHEGSRATIATKAALESRGAALGAGPRATTDGTTSRFARSADGARAAAIAYVLTGQQLLDLAPTEVPAAVRAISASGSADAQIADAQQQLGQLREVLAGGTGPTRYLQAVLATRVAACTRERARVSVWSVGVLSRAGVAQPQAGWHISTFDLVWERADWKIWSETITPGPAPALNAGAAPASSEQLDQALSGFTAWRSGR